jgi:hypothetical protein
VSNWANKRTHTEPPRAAQVDEWAVDNRWSWAALEGTKAVGLDGKAGGFLEGEVALVPKPGSLEIRADLSSNAVDLPLTPPRISPVSFKSLDYRYGNALIAWAAEVLKVELMPWQQFLLREGLVRRNGKFRYRTLLAVVARQNGKSLLSAIRILGGICLFGERFTLGSAHTRWVALEVWHLVYDLAYDAGLEVGRMRKSTGQEEFDVEGGRYKLATGSTGGARGLSGVDLVVMDELRQMNQWESYAALDKTRRIRSDSQVWAITTEGDMESTVLNRLQALGRDVIEANQTDSPIGYFEWSAAPGLAASDRRGWYQANPAMGYTLEEDTVHAEFLTDPPAVFEVEVLCRKVAQISGWVDPMEFDACASPERFPIEGPFVLALDAVPELRHVSICAGALDNGFHYLELIETFTGPRALAFAEHRLEQLLERWTPATVVTVAKSPMEPSTARIAAAAGVPHTSVRPADWAKACRGFYASVRNRQIRHPGGQAISAALAATKRGPDGLVSQVHRINDQVDNDAAIAAILAAWAPTQIHIEPVPEWTVY